MKNMFLIGTVIFLTTPLFASSDLANKLSDNFTNQSLEILAKNSSNIQLSGDISKNESLRSILEYFATYLSEGLVFDGESHPLKNKIKGFQADCAINKNQQAAAICILIIQYKPRGETAISFGVNLDQNQMPVSILENKADISRGD